MSCPLFRPRIPRIFRVHLCKVHAVDPTHGARFHFATYNFPFFFHWLFYLYKSVFYSSVGDILIETFNSCRLLVVLRTQTDFHKTNLKMYNILRFVERRNALSAHILNLVLYYCTVSHLMDTQNVYCTPDRNTVNTLITDGLMVPWVVFSVIWSIGCTCDNDGRLVFSAWLRQQMAEYDHEPQFPDEGLVYDYR